MRLRVFKFVLLFMTVFHVTALANEVKFTKEEKEDAMKNETIMITEEERQFLVDTFPGMEWWKADVIQASR